MIYPNEIIGSLHGYENYNGYFYAHYINPSNKPEEVIENGIDYTEWLFNLQISPPLLLRDWCEMFLRNFSRNFNFTKGSGANYMGISGLIVNSSFQNNNAKILSFRKVELEAGTLKKLNKTLANGVIKIPFLGGTLEGYLSEIDINNFGRKETHLVLMQKP